MFCSFILGTSTRFCCAWGHEWSTKIPNPPRWQIYRSITLSPHLFQSAGFTSLRNLWQAQNIPHESHPRVFWRIWLCLRMKEKKSTTTITTYTSMKWIQTRPCSLKQVKLGLRKRSSRSKILKIGETFARRHRALPLVISYLALFIKKRKILSVRFLYYCCFNKKKKIMVINALI